MTTLDERIALAEKHVQNGRRIVANQRQRIASGKCFDVADAIDLLDTLEQTLEIFESDLNRLLSTQISN